jgi:hypothetical protein
MGGLTRTCALRKKETLENSLKSATWDQYTCYPCQAKERDASLHGFMVVIFLGGSILAGLFTVFLFNEVLNPKIARSIFGGPLSFWKAAVVWVVALPLIVLFMAYHEDR